MVCAKADGWRLKELADVIRGALRAMIRFRIKKARTSTEHSG